VFLFTEGMVSDIGAEGICSSSFDQGLGLSIVLKEPVNFLLLQQLLVGILVFCNI